MVGYWHQWADERFGDRPPKVDPGAFSGQRQGWKTPRGPLAVHCFCVCVVGVYCWGSPWRKQIQGMWPSICPVWFILYVFIVYRRILRILCLLLYSAIYWCVCWLLWFSCQYLPIDWLERPLWGHLNVVRRLSPQSPGGRESVLTAIFQVNLG